MPAYALRGCMEVLPTVYNRQEGRKLNLRGSLNK